MHVQKIVKKNRTCKHGFKQLADQPDLAQTAKTDKIISYSKLAKAAYSKLAKADYLLKFKRIK